MASSRYLQAVAPHLAGRLHHTGTAYRCRCGQCRHLILTTARRSGLPLRGLVAALPPERPAKAKESRPRLARGSAVEHDDGPRRWPPTPSTDAVLAVVGAN